MPLLDHFHPPLSRRRHWESLHSAWANALCQQLNQGPLPPRYFAEVHVRLGTLVEVDLGTFDEHAAVADGAGEGGVATWAPPRPTRVVPLDFGHPDLFEVRVHTDQEGPRLVAVVELVSPANKDRPGHRHLFAAKCDSLLQQGIGLVVVDVVTERSGNLHAALLDLLEVPPEVTPPPDLYAGAYRSVAAGEALRLEYWLEGLAVGSPLPTLPLWIGPDLCLPLELEQAYAAACATLRI